MALIIYCIFCKGETEADEYGLFNTKTIYTCLKCGAEFEINIHKGRNE